MLGLHDPCELLAGIEHARFHRCFRNGENGGDLGDRVAVVVDEIEHFGMRGRQLSQTLAQQDRVMLLREADLGIVGRIRDAGYRIVVEYRVLPPPMAEIALKRATDSSHVDTVERPSNLPA